MPKNNYIFAVYFVGLGYNPEKTTSLIKVILFSRLLQGESQRLWRSGQNLMLLWVFIPPENLALYFANVSREPCDGSNHKLYV